MLTYFQVFGSATRWALTDTPPTYQSLNEPTRYPNLRDFTPFQALSMMFNYHRHVGIVGFKPLQPKGRSRLGYIMYHVLNLLVHKFIWNEVVHPIWLFAFSTSSSRAPLTDLQARMVDLKLVYGVPILLTRAWVSVSFLMFLHSGMAVFWHTKVIVGLITGLWGGEEFPTLMNKPFLSTSMSDLWGKRYHQYNRVSRLH